MKTDTVMFFNTSFSLWENQYYLLFSCVNMDSESQTEPLIGYLRNMKIYDYFVFRWEAVKSSLFNRYIV